MLRSKRVRISKAGKEEAGELEYFVATHLKHVGNDEYNGLPFFLEEWQRKNIWYPIFGTGKMTGGRFRRRYRSALIGMPRDFGKSELAAAMLLAEANMHPINNGQYGIVAYSKEQATKDLGVLKAMIRKDPDLKAVWDIQKHEIVNLENGSVIKVFPYSEGSLQSWHFNMIIADELHVWRDESVWNAIVSGMGSIPNSLVIAITTASGKRQGFLWDWINGTEDLVSILEDDEAYCWWHGANDEDDIDDQRVWKRIVLPSWITVEDMKRQRKRQSRANFERYSLNRFPLKQTSESFFSTLQLDRCCREDNDFDYSAPYTLGIDGATSGDSFAIVAFQRRNGIGFTKEWVFDEPDPDTGYYPLNQIMELIAAICQRSWPRVVGIDPNRMIVMNNQLLEVYGIDTVAFRQDNPTMCQATSLVVNLVLAGKLRLAGCPKLIAHLANTVKDDKGSYGERFSKDSKLSKIDAAIALAIATLAYDKVVGEEDAWSTFNT